MSEYDTSLDEIREISLKVISAAESFNIPLTKENYLTWYEYFEGNNTELKAEVDDIKQKKKEFTPQICSYLYTKHISAEKNKMMNHVQAETQKMLKEVLSNILDASDASSNYEKKISAYSEGLSDAEDTHQVQNIISSIIEESKLIAKSNRNLQKEFEKASAQTNALNQKLKKIESQALTDTLTGLYNRRAFDKDIQNLLEKYKQNGELFSIIILDIDHFKKFNDTYGHQTGDEVLKNVGEILLKGSNGNNIPYRYGGEEFVILLPGSKLEDAAVLAEQIRIRIAVKRATDPGTGAEIDKITTSLGISQINPEDDIQSVIERADKALYHAKDSGRNTIKTERDI